MLPEVISATPETCSTKTSRDAAVTEGSQGTADGALGPAKKNGGKCHECTICGRRFTRKQYLHNHQILHTGEKPHVCPVCGRSFAQRNGYIQHRRIHSKEMPYVCELCSSKFCKKESLNRHRQLHASGVELYHCDECSKVFTSRLVLQRHQWWHKGEKSYPCRLCPATFVSSKDLDRHSLVHTGERPYICSVCHKSFAWKKNLKLHMHRMHSRLIESVASVSGTADFAQSRDEKIFRVLPRVDKEFSCHLCPAVFKCSTDMDKHVAVHIGERPHVCPVCRKRFAWKNNLVLHVRRRHGGVTTSETVASKSGRPSLLNDLPSTLAPNRSNVAIKAEPCSPTTTLPPVMRSTDIKAEPSSPMTKLPFTLLSPVSALERLCLLTKNKLEASYAETVVEAMARQLPSIFYLHIHYVDIETGSKTSMTWIRLPEDETAGRPSKGKVVSGKPCIMCSTQTFVALAKPRYRELQEIEQRLRRS